MNLPCSKKSAILILALAARSLHAGCDVNGPAVGYRFPVVLPIPSAFAGTPVDRFIAWSFKGNIWQKIVLQVDEKNHEGSYVLEEGLPYTKNSDNGLADENDEISFRGGDLGEVFASDKLTPSVTESMERFKRLDICVGESFAGSILVGHAKTRERPIIERSLFNKKLQVIDALAYRYVFNAKRPMLVGEVFLKSQGREFPVFAESTFVMPIVPRLWILPGFRFDEEDFKSEIECWRQGPVRTIVAVGAKLRKFFSIVQLHLFSELVFYDDFFQIPTQIEMVFDANGFLDYGSGLAYILRFPKGDVWELSSNLADLPATSELGGGTDDAPKVTAKQYSPDGVFRTWGTRAEGSFLAQVRVDDKAINEVPPPFIIKKAHFNDPNRRKSWGWLKHNTGDLGVYLDISRVRKGIYDFALDLMLSPRANDGFTDFRSVHGEWTSFSRE